MDGTVLPKFAVIQTCYGSGAFILADNDVAMNMKVYQIQYTIEM